MSPNRKSSAPLLLAGLAAFAYYKYNKMSPEQKQELTGNIKEKGKKLYDKYVPQSVKNMFNKEENKTEFADV